MPKYYNVNEEGISSANEIERNLVIISESKENREDTENEFVAKYDLTGDIFDLIE